MDGKNCRRLGRGEVEERLTNIAAAVLAVEKAIASFNHLGYIEETDRLKAIGERLAMKHCALLDQAMDYESETLIELLLIPSKAFTQNLVGWLFASYNFNAPSISPGIGAQMSELSHAVVTMSVATASSICLQQKRGNRVGLNHQGKEGTCGN